MRRERWIGGGIRFSVALAVTGVVLALSSASSAQQPAAPSLPACIGVATESRYVPYGYNHVVVLKNGCSKAATCSVATDVNPKASSAEVNTGATVEVLTFAGSPAQAFTARVTCKLH